MNCGIILLFLLCCNQNGRIGGNTGCGCDRPEPPCRPRERECGCESGRERGCEGGRDRDKDREGCPCNNDSRFEPRFEPRPFSDVGCGCNDK